MTPFFHEPFKPSSFVCEPATALIITMGGEIEVVSPKCSAALAPFAKFAGTGRTSSMLDEELILLGDDDLGTKGQYISIQKPRDGLLAMTYTVHNHTIRHLPHQHSAMVSRNILNVVGGKFKSREKLSKFTWKELSLNWENGTKFSPDFISACTVKLGVDTHMILGGERNVDGRKIGVTQVVKINQTDEIVYKMNPLKLPRVSHACELLSPSVILVSGGLTQQDSTEILPDELYIFDEPQNDGRVIEHSLKRTRHSLIKMGEEVWALGGRDSSGQATKRIAVFNPATDSWTDRPEKLQSTHTSEITVTPYPASSLDCVAQCQCGETNTKARIFNGGPVEVRI